MRRFRSFFQKFFSKKIFKKIFKNFFVSSREKWFSSHIEHERHTLGVSKVFSKLFMNTSWAYLENWAFWALDIAPTLDVPVLLFFFRQTADLIVNVPLFSTDFIRFTVNPAVTGSSPCFNQKLFRAFAKADETEWSVPSFNFFSTLCDFSKFFCLQRVPPSSFSFCSKLKCQKA